MGVGDQPTPRPLLPPGKTRYPLYRRLGGPQDRSGRAENLVPTGILSRTVQPLVSRYADWATRPRPITYIFAYSLSPRNIKEIRVNTIAIYWHVYSVCMEEFGMKSVRYFGSNLPHVLDRCWLRFIIVSCASLSSSSEAILPTRRFMTHTKAFSEVYPFRQYTESHAEADKF